MVESSGQNPHLHVVDLLTISQENQYQGKIYDSHQLKSHVVGREKIKESGESFQQTESQSLRERFSWKKLNQKAKKFKSNFPYKLNKLVTKVQLFFSKKVGVSREIVNENYKTEVIELPDEEFAYLNKLYGKNLDEFRAQGKETLRLIDIRDEKPERSPEYSKFIVNMYSAGEISSKYELQDKLENARYNPKTLIQLIQINKNEKDQMVNFDNKIELNFDLLLKDNQRFEDGNYINLLFELKDNNFITEDKFKEEIGKEFAYLNEVYNNESTEFQTQGKKILKWIDDRNEKPEPSTEYSEFIVNMYSVGEISSKYELRDKLENASYSPKTLIQLIQINKNEKDQMVRFDDKIELNFNRLQNDDIRFEDANYVNFLFELKENNFITEDKFTEEIRQLNAQKDPVKIADSISNSEIPQERLVQLTQDLLKVQIEEELSKPNQESLLRGNTVATKLFGLVAKNLTKDFLDQVSERLKSEKSQGQESVNEVIQEIVDDADKYFKNTFPEELKAIFKTIYDETKKGTTKNVNVERFVTQTYILRVLNPYITLQTTQNRNAAGIATALQKNVNQTQNVKQIQDSLDELIKTINTSVKDTDTKVARELSQKRELEPIELKSPLPSEAFEKLHKDTTTQEIERSNKEFYRPYNEASDLYRDILSPSDTKVDIKMEEDESVFFHANHVNFDERGEGFLAIATQAPAGIYSKEIDANSFWQVAFQQRPLIVDLSNRIYDEVIQEQESDLKKYDQIEEYYPTAEGESYETKNYDIELTAKDLDENSYEDWTFRATQKGEEGLSEEIRRLRFKNWPDRGAPELKNFKEFVFKTLEVINQRKENDSPPFEDLMVHCRAGVGRTGVFLVALQLTDEFQKGKIVDREKIFDHIHELILKGRLQRGDSFVQSDRQLGFLYDYAMDLLNIKEKN
ncbi:MAG: hypothetical protein Tsb0021_11120 [Chlamydiales bacterium]